MSLLSQQQPEAMPNAQGVSNALRQAISPRQRPPRPNALTCAMAFGWRALLKIKYVPEQVFDVLITPIMFTVIFTYLFGGALAGSTADYLQFLLPGILVQTTVFTSMYTGLTLNTDISKGVYDRFKSLPIWAPAPIVGAMLGDILRYSGAATIVMLVGLIMGYRPEAGIVGVVPSFIVLNIFGLGFSWVFIALGLTVRTPGAVMTLSWLALMPITFASNIYVNPATMPNWLQQVVAVNPVTHLVTAMRELLTGTPTFTHLALALLAPAVLTTIFGPLTMYLYRRER